MILVLSVVGGVLVGLLGGGRLQNLGKIQLRYPSLIITFFLLQAVLRSPAAQRLGIGPGLVVFLWSGCATVLVLLAFLNRGIPGMKLLLVGLLANLVVVVANAGMPLASGAAESLGATPADIEASLDLGFYVIASPNTTAWFLGDVIAVPWPPFRSVLSFGDIVMCVGAGVFVARGMHVGSTVPAPASR